MFYNELRPDFKGELLLHVMKSYKLTFLLTLELELYDPNVAKQFLKPINIGHVSMKSGFLGFTGFQGAYTCKTQDLVLLPSFEPE